MNERFLFRAWDSIDKELIYMADNTDLLDDWLTWDKTYTIMQSTGLKDKNGKLIFESDIVKCSDDGIVDIYVRTIKWGNDYPAFEAVPVHGSAWNELQFFAAEGYIEIIGNIHENTEGDGNE